MRYQEIITELFNKPADWKVTASTDREFIADFTIGKGDFEFQAMVFKPVDLPYSVWSVGFTRNGRYSLTNTGSQFEVFATVKAIMSDFIFQKTPDVFRFSADKDENSRVSLYAKLSRSLSSQHGYKLEEIDKGSFVYFMLSKQ
jgi:hypothetical protein